VLVGVAAVLITLFDTVRIRSQKREGIIRPLKFGQSGKTELGIVQEVGT